MLISYAAAQTFPSSFLFSHFLPSLTFILSYLLLFNIPTTTTTTTSTPNLIQRHQMCDHHDWVNFAMADDSIVADLLLRINRPQSHPSLQLHWRVRQQRSRSLPKHAAKPESTRVSPTTPLSWNGATSASEESSLPAKFSETSKSNIMVANPKETVTTTKSKRKKTLAELKEEESLLLKERRNLKNELVSLRLTVEKERATNESLKKMKFDFELRQKSNTAITSEVYGKIVYSHPSNSPVNAANASLKVQQIGNQEPKYVLPDLNLLVDEDLSSNVVHCIS